jgi:hypothetical protein
VISKCKGLLSLALTLSASTALADADYFSPTNELIAISLGVMKISPATSLRLDNTTATGTVTGTTFNGENDLGLDSSRTEPKFEAAVRAGKRDRLFFDYFILDRDDTKTLANGPAQFGNIVLLAGDPVQTDMSMRLFSVGFGHSFLHGEKFELTALIAVNEIETNASLRVQSLTRHLFDEKSLAGPLPTPGVAATWAVSRRFYIDANAKYMKLSVDHLTGTASNYDVDIFYRLHPNVALALGYIDARVNLVSRQAGNTGAFDFDAKGPELFVRVAF